MHAVINNNNRHTATKKKWRYKNGCGIFLVDRRGRVTKMTEITLWYKLVCIPDTKSKHSPNPNRNPTTEQHSVANIQVNIVTCPTYSEKFIRDNVIAPFSILLVIVTLSSSQKTTSNDVVSVVPWNAIVICINATAILECISLNPQHFMKENDIIPFSSVISFSMAA